jgi:hypothetical protein
MRHLIPTTIALVTVTITALGFPAVTAAESVSFSVAQQGNPNIPERFRDDMPDVSAVQVKRADDTDAMAVQWRTAERANGKVVYSTDPHLERSNSTIVYGDERGTQHTVELPDVTADTVYFYYVMSEDEDYNTSRSPRRAFVPGVGDVDDELALDLMNL